MSSFDSVFGAWLRGPSSARGEARRILDVLVERGDLSRAEADQIENAIAGAVGQHQQWLDERVLAPLRRAFGGAGEARETTGGAASLDARLAAIEARLERIERALAGRGER